VIFPASEKNARRAIVKFSLRLSEVTCALLQRERERERESKRKGVGEKESRGGNKSKTKVARFRRKNFFYERFNESVREWNFADSSAR